MIIKFIVIIAIIIFCGKIIADDTEKKTKNSYKDKGMEFKQTISSTKYCGGFDGIGTTELCIIEHVDDFLNIRLSNSQPRISAIRQIRIVDILKVEVQTESQIRERVSMGKLMLFGIFAFAMSPKEHITNTNYVLIKIDDEGSNRDIIFKPENCTEFISQIDKIRGYDRIVELKNNNMYV